jgi:16S rRNA (adenine1518-N6/adenine1519-N6)-dimethyltransferase
VVSTTTRAEPATGLRTRTRARLEELGARPSRDLGQNFLVDGNVLDAVEEAAELSPSDVVLEVGGGLGVLSERLAANVGHLHVVEVDPVLAGALDVALAPFENVSLHRGDAVRLDLAALWPAPSKLVANLPYGVAATVLLKSLEELADARLFVAMVQREVGERLAAAPGSRVYGATSVLAQLSCEVRVHRRVARSAFVPAPNVDSAIVVLRRRAAAPTEGVRRLVRAAFAHRRKTLPGSLALYRGGGSELRDRARAALGALGHAADARAERLWPAEFVALAELLTPEAADVAAPDPPPE